MVGWVFTRSLCFILLPTAAPSTTASPISDLHSPLPPPEMNFDQILSTVGGFGKYQKILYIWICLPQILLAFHMMVSIFTGATPPHQCRDGTGTGTGSGSGSGSGSSAGNRSAVSGGAILNFTLQESSCFSADAPLPGNRTERVPCAQGWVYSRETFESTTVTEVGCVGTAAAGGGAGVLN